MRDAFEDHIELTVPLTGSGIFVAIYHGIVVVLMPIYGLMARRFFRRKEDSDEIVAEDGKEGLMHIHLESPQTPVDPSPEILLDSDGISNA